MVLDADPRPGTRPLDQTILGRMGIEIVEASGKRVELRMPVGPAVHQPYGLLHGGASVVLAESAASTGGGIAAGDGRRVFGIQISANHLRPVRDGVVTAVGVPIHLGRTTQVWRVDIRDAAGRLACTSRCTLAVRDVDDGNDD